MTNMFPLLTFIIITCFSLILIYILITNMINVTSLIINLLFYSLLLCIMLSLWSNSYIYSIILFLSMISGLLVIFLYFMSFISNSSTNLTIKSLLMMSFFTNMLIFLYLLMSYPTMSTMPVIYMQKMLSIINNPSPDLFHTSLIYTYPFNIFTIICIMFLLISLFSVIKICSTKSSSLRKIK